jgi:hypothetical protein
MAWFNPFNNGWFNGWFRSSENTPTDVFASFSFQGTSTFNVDAVASEPASPTTSSPIVGGYSKRNKSKIRWGEHPKFVYAEFKIDGSSTFNAQTTAEAVAKLQWVEDPSVIAFGCKLELKSEFLTFNWKQTSNFKIASKVIKKQSKIKVEAVEIDLLEEEELALLLLI